MPFENAFANTPIMQIGGTVKAKIIIMIPLMTWCLAMAIIDRTKHARNSGAEIRMNPGETISKTIPAIRQRNDQKEGFQSFCRSAGTLITSTGTGRVLGT